MTERIQEFLRNRRSEGQDTEPCLVVDLEVVRDNYRPSPRPCGQPRVLRGEGKPGAGGAVRCWPRWARASTPQTVAEIEMALAAGATPDRVSYGNTIKKERDIARAFALGIRLFAVDCAAEVEKVARAAPGAKVFCRILYDCAGADGRCRASSAAIRRWRSEVLDLAKRLGLEPCGISFHVGSQQRKVKAWDRALSMASTVSVTAPSAGSTSPWSTWAADSRRNTSRDVPPVVQYGPVDLPCAAQAFGNQIPETIIEPGRGMVGNAGIIETEVVLISRKSDEDEVRWVYLDIGKFGGLAETMDESIRYPSVPRHDGADMTPCVLAGPDLRFRRRAVREDAVSASRWTLEIGDKLLDRRHRGLYVDLLGGGVQRHPAAADLPHLSCLL